eukprot:gene10007-18633_t
MGKGGHCLVDRTKNSWNGRSLFYFPTWERVPDTSILSDAAGAVGFAAINRQSWLAAEWPPGADADACVCVNHLVDFYHKIICKELMTRSLENETASNNQQEIVPVCCYCQKPCGDTEPMVRCDNLSCQYQWIHFQCARPKLKRPPGGAWYCEDCKKKKRSETK